VSCKVGWLLNSITETASIELTQAYYFSQRCTSRRL